ncbi:hypothetical protein ACVWWD_005708 [Mesorhizobium sp. URHB0026]
MTTAALALACRRFDSMEGRVTNLGDTFLNQPEDSINVSAGVAGLNPFSSAAAEAE